MGRLDRHGLDGEARLGPRAKAPRERTDALDAAAPQKQRHPGAGGLVRSRAVEDHVSVAWNLLQVPLEILRARVHGSRNHHRVGPELERVTEIYDHRRFAGVDLPLELGRGDSRDPQGPDEALAPDVLTRKEESEAAEHQAEKPGAQRSPGGRDLFDLGAEEIA